MEDSILYEDFAGPEMHTALRWFCPPLDFYIDPASHQFVIRPDEGTDFWQKTHYGFQPDNGHFLNVNLHNYTEPRGEIGAHEDFRLTTRVHARPVHRFDQSGIMVRYSSQAWIKSSVEYIPDAKSKLGAVVTAHGYSDWSTQDVSESEVPTYFRVSKTGDDFLVECSTDGRSFEQIRMAHLEAPEAGCPLLVGIYACSPQGKGFEARFDFISVERL